MRKIMATLGLAVLLVFGAPDAAEAQEQDGLVNVVIGDITILEDVRIGVAANVAANICGVRVGPVAVLARTVDRSGDSEIVCEIEGQEIVLEQN